MIPVALITLALGVSPTNTPEVIQLWPTGAPGAVGKDEDDIPTLTVYSLPADKANGTAIILCPGGGYFYLTGAKEGKLPAEWLNNMGVTAFVLKYRLAPRYRHPAPLQDATRAMRYVRSHAKQYHLDPERIGIWGFSAGGHLASTLATRYDSGNPKASDPIERVGCRPDFAILSYPVITMDITTTNLITRRALLGPLPSRELIDYLSNEKHVNAKTPPTFLFHTSEDPLVSPENSVLFYQALRKAKVPAEIHLFEKGTHGVPLIQKDDTLSPWGKCLAAWLKKQRLLDRSIYSD
jgi:acetyl esterase/lipase